MIDSVAGQPFVCFAIGNRTPKMGNGFEGMEIARHQSLGRHFRRVRELSDAGFHGTEARGDPRLLRMAFTVAPLFCIERLNPQEYPCGQERRRPFRDSAASRFAGCAPARARLPLLHAASPRLRGPCPPPLRPRSQPPLRYACRTPLQEYALRWKRCRDIVWRTVRHAESISSAG